MILGAVLAGGRSARFGSDKALAMLGGQTLLERAVAYLNGQCDAVIVVGRKIAPATCISDWPAPNLGPLGGLAAALRHARDHGFIEVLSLPVDAVVLDKHLPAALNPAPAYVAGQPVIGRWPAHTAVAIESILASQGKHSLRALVEATGARAVSLPTSPININTLADLALAKESWDDL